MKNIFQKIIDREIPAKIVYENDQLIVINDISPQAPVHLLIIPKVFLANLLSAESEHQDVLGQLLIASRKVAEQLGLESYRIVINNGDQAGQTVPHLHLHLLAGRDLYWPPG